ncbi:site-specific integrase [Spirosoma daeguense]
MIAQIDIYLDTRRQKKDGTYPAKLRITYKRKCIYFHLTNTTAEAFEKTKKPKPREDYIKDLKAHFKTEADRAETIIQMMTVFSFEEFEKRYTQTEQKTRTVGTIFDEIIARLKNEGRISTMQSYQTTWNNLLKYHRSKSPLQFQDITPDWLAGFEKYLSTNGVGKTSAGIYSRTIRAVFNTAIADGLISRESYPFGNRRYQPPASRNIKKALTVEDIRKIMAYKSNDEREEKARDFWVFSYLCNGINVKDICRLRYQDVGEKFITFVRSKTARTRRVEDIIRIALLPEVAAIIKRWGNRRNGNPDQRVFPVLGSGVNPVEERNKVQLVTRFINTYVRKVAEAVGVEKDVTTYTARHSFATVLKRSGAPLEYISESLGHNDMRTTKSYLDSFEDDMIVEHAKNLL